MDAIHKCIRGDATYFFPLLTASPHFFVVVRKSQRKIMVSGCAYAIGQTIVRPAPTRKHGSSFNYSDRPQDDPLPVLFGSSECGVQDNQGPQAEKRTRYSCRSHPRRQNSEGCGGRRN
jgi:hypothetical protein